MFCTVKGIPFPEPVVFGVDCVPRSKLPCPDSIAEAVIFIFAYQLPACIDPRDCSVLKIKPAAYTTAAKHLTVATGFIDVFCQNGYPVPYEHIAVRIPRIHAMQNFHRAGGMLDVFGSKGQFFQLVSFMSQKIASTFGLISCRRPCRFKNVLQQFHRVHNFPGGIAGKHLGFNLLHLCFPFIPFFEFIVIAGKRIHIIHPKIGRHNIEAIFSQIIADQAKRKRNIELGRIIAFIQQHKGRKPAVMLERRRKSRPKSPTGDNLSIIAAGIVV